MTEKRRHGFLISLAVNAVILAGMLMLTDMAYETNDDFAITSRIVAGYPYVGFVNYYLCKVLIGMQHLIPGINWYVILMIAASFAAFTCILYVIYEAGESRIVSIAATVMAVFFAFDHYSTIQFTKTAALVMTAGMLLLVDCITEKKKAPGYIVALVFVYLGAMIRVDALLAAAGFAGIYGLIWLFMNRKRLISDKYFTAPRIALYVLLVALVFGAYELDQLSCRINVSTPELRYAEDYSLYRSNIVDYPTYEYYEDHIAEYDAIGISQNDIYLIDHWVFDYEGAASMENLRNIDSIERNNDSKATVMKKGIRKCLKDIYSGLQSRSFTGIHIIYLGCLALWLILALKPKHWWYVIGTGLMALALYFAIYYMQRPAYRALYVADIGAAVWLLYYLMKNCNEGESKVRTAVHVIMGIAVIAAALMLMLPAYSGTEAKVASAQKKIMSEEMQDYFMQHDDSFYVWATTEKKQPRVYATPWLAPTGTDRNVTGTGGWGVLSPYMLGKLGEYGIYSPIKDLIDNENAFYVGNKRIKRMEEYYNKWYGSPDRIIYMEQVDEIDGNKIWRVRSGE